MNLHLFLSKLSAWYRFFVVSSFVWLIVTLSVTNPWSRSWTRWAGGSGTTSHWDDFLIDGVLPVVAFWGVLWIVHGFKNGRKEK